MPRLFLRKVLVVAVALLLWIVGITPSSAIGQNTGGELRVGMLSEPLGLDPQMDTNKTSVNYIEHIYSTLIRFSPDMKLVPDLATSWRAMNETTYEFTLRRGVRFHSGREMTSGDVKYSLERVLDPNVKSAKADLLKSVKEIQAPDPYTVRIILVRPFAPLLTYLATGFTSIVPRETVAQYGNLKRNSNGTGPFRLDRWAAGQYIRLVRNDSYYERGLPRLRSLTFHIVPDEKMLTAQLRAKRLDWVELYDFTEIPTLRKIGFQVLGGTGLNWRYLAFNTVKKPFDDARVRLAVALALNRENIVQTAFFGYATAAQASATAPPGAYAYANDPMFKQADLTRAKRLLTEAGYPDGFKATLKFPSNWPVYQQMAQPVQSQLKALGVDFELVPVDWGLLSRELTTGSFDAAISGWTGFVDPDEQLFNVFHSTGGLNYMHFKDARVDALLEEGRVTVDPAKRERIYISAQQRIMELSPHVFLVHANTYYALAANVRGFKSMLSGAYLTFKDTWVEP